MTLIRSLPNLLTGARLALGVLVFALLGSAAQLLRSADPVDDPYPAAARLLIVLAFLGFVVAALTDFFDGWLARRLQAQSAWGTILDPIADKIAVVAVVLGLMWLEPRAGIAVPGFIILFRELFVSGLREAGAGRGLSFPVTRLAKWKTTVQLVALSVETLAPAAPATPSLAMAGDGLLWLAAAMTLWTGAEYAVSAARQL